jgi:hypothetical protein
MALFSLKIATIAVAPFVDKSQLSAIGPDPDDYRYVLH